MAVRVIFIGGLGRSGTTLLERLLGEVPGVAPLGEVVHLWERGVLGREPCGCGEAFTACAFWRRVGVRAFGGWSSGLADRVIMLRRRVDRTRRIPGLAVRRRHPDLSGYTRAYSRVYEAAAQVAARPVVVDSSKHASLAFCLLTSPVVDLSVVHLVRDPRAVAHSWQRHVRRPEDGAPMTRWRPWRTAVHWVVQNLAFELLALRNGTVVRVRYEDLLADPPAVLVPLLAQLGLPTGPRGDPPGLSGFAAGHRVAELSMAHTCSGNPMRFTTGTLELRLDDTWCDRLPRHHRWLVTALTWPLMIRYGYRPCDSRGPVPWLPPGVTASGCR
ncbi:sulfotransferase [Sphaerisporangium rubeum]|uniref:Sulfotransferase n=1 Tax=Sphaerisporangium rubeum TaxID=321317 RepID=A0A7X0IK22_9ACTN|nr:hypothetical protein [Sphaerisporangium rubeum]